MASSTITILQSMEWAKKFISNRRTALGDYLEPAITSANLVMQTIVGPPFVWRWNRAIKTFTLANGTQDYPQLTSDFGWIEKCSVQDPTTSNWKEIQAKISLGLDSAKAYPANVSAQIDDGAGNITFRFMPVPEKAYPVSITYQKKASLITGVNDTWSPIPDEYSYIYQWGFLAMMWMFADDPKFNLANQRFIAHLLGANQGLTQTEINIFLSRWQEITGQPMVNANTMQQGYQGRIAS